MANQFAAPYVLPIHHDLLHSQADPQVLSSLLAAEVMDGNGWHFFQNRRRVKES
jgi:hypothetical protein